MKKLFSFVPVLAASFSLTACLLPPADESVSSEGAVHYLRAPDHEPRRVPPKPKARHPAPAPRPVAHKAPHRGEPHKEVRRQAPPPKAQNRQPPRPAEKKAQRVYPPQGEPRR